ncbi:ribosomal RNA small subunit methyltransferase H [Bacteroidia bacterium]|nr:ribosomal RNA small subunit methyltransferase H [Bacteroidia bacterium]
MSDYHRPVLLKESVDMLGIEPAGTYVDLTFGGGGHSREILSRLGRRGRLVAFDQDAEAAANRPDDERLTLVHGNFRFMRGQLRLLGIREVDGVLADLGVSSHHFDTPERGFSFRADGPLDMRMNRRGTLTAEKVLGSYTRDELTRILRDWGEIETPWKVASCIERARADGPLTTTGQLLEAVAPCTPRKDPSKFLSKLFQAVRIEVNGEMPALGMALQQSLRTLRPGGRLAVISYHSLEDRMVKNFMRSGNFAGTVEKDFYGVPQTPFTEVSKGIAPGGDEQQSNPRSRSARLRSATKR